MMVRMTESRDDQQSDHFQDFAPERVPPVAKDRERLTLADIPLSSEDEKS